MSDINPNTPVTAPIKAEVPNGGESLTFDELEAATSKSKSRSPKQASDDIPAEVDAKIKSEPKKESKGDDGKAEKKAEKKEAGEEEKKELAAEKARKVLKAKLRDKELELDDETLIPVKINGKEEYLTLQELRADRAGKVAWDKKFSEIDKLEKAVKQNDKRLAQQKEQIKAMFEEQDPELRLYKLSELSGVSPVQFRQQFLENNVKMLEKWHSMSEDERKADALEFENKYLKYQSETMTKQQQLAQAQREHELKVSELMATHKVSRDEFESLKAELEAFVEKGTLKAEELTPEYIVGIAQKSKLWEAAVPEIEALKLPWSPQETQAKLVGFVDDAHQAGFKPEDVPDLISEIWGTKKTQSIAKEKTKARQEFLEGKETPLPKGNQGDAMFFEELT